MSQLLLEKTPPHALPTKSAVESPSTPFRATVTRAPRPRKSRLQQVSKHAMHWVRRGHLYFGLFLFPWALLYGVTAFLFNHPTAFSDQKSMSFDRADYGGDKLPTPSVLAAEVLAKLNAAQKPPEPYEFGAGETRFVREFAFATFKSDKSTYNLLLDLNSGAGTIREQPAPRQTASEKLERAPFATAEIRNGPPGARRGGGSRQRDGQSMPAGRETPDVETSFKSQLETLLPQICKSANLNCYEPVITSIPELSFPVRVGKDDWIASYNPLLGSVSGRKASAEPPSELTWRRFLLRLHTAHGYPSSGGVRWVWAVIVDVMAGVMCFWGLSGILMWWQIKSTRLIGMVTVILGLLAATGLGVGMHFAMQ